MKLAPIAPAAGFKWSVPISFRCRGFTLIEMVLAIFVFSIGALGLAATTAVITRSLAWSAIRERARRVAEGRIESLRALSCGLARSGSETRQGITSTWTVTQTGTSVSIVESVTYNAGGATRTDAYPALVRCAE